jgi:hypothetical protein
MRLDPTVNIAALNLTPLGRMVAEALQRYGMVLRDRTQDALLFYAEQPAPGQGNPYPAWFGGKQQFEQFRGIPWDKMQLMPLSNSSCSALAAPVGLPVNSFCGMPYSLTDGSPQGGSMTPGSPGTQGSSGSKPNSSAKKPGSSGAADSSRPQVVRLDCQARRVRIAFISRAHSRVRRVTVTVDGRRRHARVSLSPSRRSLALRLGRNPHRRMTVTLRVWVKRGRHVTRRTIRRVYPACG